ncbi:hypothetical protein BC826DRAFT_969517 [Russula brevipes]|nr:hypothetical protein BC826DRAFT_969517 [Russula brevipes]
MRLKCRSLQLLCVLLVPIFILVPHHSSTRDAISYAATLRLVDALLDEALDLSLSIGLTHPNGSRIHLTLAGAEAPPTFAPHGSPSPSSFVLSGDALSARVCRILQGKTIILVGPHDTLYQLHSFLLSALYLGTESTVRASCPGPSYCPFHPICQPPRSGSESLLTPADVTSTNNSSAALLRFLHSGNLNPSPTQEERGHDHPLVDPRTDVRVIDSRWVRQAAAKASVLVLNRSPLPAPAWSYTTSTAAASARNLTWLSTLRALELAHPEPLSHHFTGVLSRLDNDEHEHEHSHHRHGRHARRPRRPSAGDSDAQQVVRAALHTTLSTFLPALLQTLRTLRAHARHRPVLGKKPVLWYGSWFLPRSCSPDSLSAFASASDSRAGRDDHPPRRRRLLLARLLAEAEAMDDPWNAYYNAQVYMHDRLLAQLLPTYGVHYLSSLSTVAPPVRARHFGKVTALTVSPDWSCIQRVFETPRGAVMGQKFLRDFVDALDSWNWSNV